MKAAIHVLLLLTGGPILGQKNGGVILQVAMCREGTEEILLTDSEYGMDNVSLQTRRTRKALHTEVIRAMVEVFDPAGSLVAKSKTDAAGKIILSFLGPGAYSVRFTVTPLLTTTGAFEVREGERKSQFFPFCISDRRWKHFFDSLQQVNRPYLDSAERKN
jgi:hypothetical protein